MHRSSGFSQTVSTKSKGGTCTGNLFSGRRVPMWRRLLVLATCLGLVTSGGSFDNTWPLSRPGAFAAQGSADCVLSGPENGAYVAQVCISAPANGSTISGDTTVAAEITIEQGVAPSIRHVQFLFASSTAPRTSPLFRDYTEPFSFILPTERWRDRESVLEVEVMFDDTFTTSRASIEVTLDNGISVPASGTGRWEPFSIDSGVPVVAAVGDSGGGVPASDAVSELIQGWDPDMLLYLGDIYNFGTYTEFLNHYDPTLGRMKEITNPVPGDHEGGSQFQGYRDYWNSNYQFYAANAGDWRIIGLDSTRRSAQTSPGTTQFEWLRQELAATDPSTCTMVFFHEPRWALIMPEDYAYLNELWVLLAESGVDLVITGHEHKYERWTPLNADGEPDQDGLVQFVVGTGGQELLSSRRSDPRLEVAQDGPGALRMELWPDRAEFQFINTDGATIDTGSVGCRGGEDELEATELEASELVTAEAPGTAATIINTGGAGVRCRTQPAIEAEVIVVLPEGARVELLGDPVGEWQPVSCAGRDGYVYRDFVDPDQAAKAAPVVNRWPLWRGRATEPLRRRRLSGEWERARLAQRLPGQGMLAVRHAHSPVPGTHDRIGSCRSAR